MKHKSNDDLKKHKKNQHIINIIGTIGDILVSISYTFLLVIIIAFAFNLSLDTTNFQEKNLSTTNSSYISMNQTSLSGQIASIVSILFLIIVFFVLFKRLGIFWRKIVKLIIKTIKAEDNLLNCYFIKICLALLPFVFITVIAQVANAFIIIRSAQIVTVLTMIAIIIFSFQSILADLFKINSKSLS